MTKVMVKTRRRRRRRRRRRKRRRSIREMTCEVFMGL